MSLTRFDCNLTLFTFHSFVRFRSFRRCVEISTNSLSSPFESTNPNLLQVFAITCHSGLPFNRLFPIQWVFCRIFNCFIQFSVYWWCFKLLCDESCWRGKTISLCKPSGNFSNIIFVFQSLHKKYLNKKVSISLHNVRWVSFVEGRLKRFFMFRYSTKKGKTFWNLRNDRPIRIFWLLVF